MPSNHLILCFPLLLPPSIFCSLRVFSKELVLHIRWPKYWSFIFSINLSSEYSGLISFRMDWLDLLAVQGTLKSLLQLHSSKAPILWRSAFFIVQLSHPYMTTGKTIALTRWTFVGKVMSLLFNMLSRLVTGQRVYGEGSFHSKYILLFSCSVVSDSLRPHGLQQARLLCASLSPWVCSNSCTLNRWCHPTISSSVAPFSSCPQSFPATRSYSTGH